MFFYTENIPLEILNVHFKEFKELGQIWKWEQMFELQNRFEGDY